MDATLVHLNVHHFPVVLSLAGGISSLAGLILRRPFVTHFGALSLLLAGLAAPVAYISGKLAASVALPGAMDPTAATLRSALDVHETSGLIATVALVLAGVAAAAWLRRRTIRLAAALALLGLASAGLAVLAGWEGGRIRHQRPAGPTVQTEVRSAKPEAGSANLEDGDRRKILVRLSPQIGEDVVQLHDHPKQLLVERFVDD
jgi:uncharacterized membrane protein